MIKRLLLLALLIAVWGLGSTHALAADTYYLVEPTTTVYIYQERDLFGLPLDRTRVIQSLGMFASVRGGAVDYDVMLLIRIWGEFGRDETESAALAEQGRLGVQLLTASVEFKRLFDAVDVLLGRSLQLDAIGATVSDGIRLTLRRNWFWGAELFIGSPVRNIEQRLLREHERSTPDIDPFAAPYPLEEQNRSRSLMVGASLFLDSIESTQLKVSWRKTWADESLNSTESHFIGGIFEQRLLNSVISLDASAVFNLYLEELQSLRFGASTNLAPLRLRIGYEYELPLFPAWSVFALFPYLPRRSVVAEAGIFFNRVYASLWYMRSVYIDSGLFPSTIAPEGRFADEIMASATWHPERLPLLLRISGIGSWGYGGDFGILSVYADYSLSNRLSVSGSAHLQAYGKLTWLDQLLAAQIWGLAGGATAKVSYFVVPEVALVLGGEYYSSPVLAQDFRLLLRIETKAVP